MLGISVMALVFTVKGWTTALDEKRLYIPPDLSQGVTLKVGEIPESFLYTFADHIWPAINHWLKDGYEEAPLNIYNYQAFITPACSDNLQSVATKKMDSGELLNRSRQLHSMKGHGYLPDRVVPIGPGRWVVALDYNLQEQISGKEVKNINLRYWLNITEYDVDKNLNPWGLGIDCHYAPAEKIELGQPL